MFVADVIAHMVRSLTLPGGGELAHMLYVSFGSLAVLVVPLAISGLSAEGVLDVGAALRAIAVVLAATLVAVALLAVRRLRVPMRQKVVALSCVTGLSVAALAVELLVH